MTKLAVFLMLSLASSFGISKVEAQLAEERSIPEPTELHSAAMADGSDVIWSKMLGDIEGSDARATITAIEVEGADGIRVRGVKIALKKQESSDYIYLTDKLLASVRDELKELDYASQWYGKCEARVRCIQGIARCRPSSTEKQAFCPGLFTTPGSESGFVLSTPRNSFSFLSVDAGQFEELIGNALEIFEQR